MPDIKTPMQAGELIPLEVAAGATMYAGHIVAVNAAGYAVLASDTANLNVMGRSEEWKDNSAGNDGDMTVMVRRKLAFLYKNDETNPVTIAHTGKQIYVKDSETVSSSGGTNNIAAGKCIGFENGKVWVEIN